MSWPTAREAAQHLPGAVDVVDAPAAVPGALRGLLVAQELGRARDHRVPGAELGEVAQTLEHAAGDVGGAGIDHRVVVGERDVGQPRLVVVAIEAAPSRRRGSACRASRSGRARSPAPARLRWPRRATGARLLQHHQRHAGVVDVGIELVAPLEVPAARAARGCAPTSRRLAASACRAATTRPAPGSRGRTAGPTAPARARPAPCPRPATGMAARASCPRRLVAQQQAVERAQRLAQRRVGPRRGPASRARARSWPSPAGSRPARRSPASRSSIQAAARSTATLAQLAGARHPLVALERAVDRCRTARSQRPAGRALRSFDSSPTHSSSTPHANGNGRTGLRAHRIDSGMKIARDQLDMS